MAGYGHRSDGLLLIQLNRFNGGSRRYMPLGNRRFFMLCMKTVRGFTVSTGHIPPGSAICMFQLVIKEARPRHQGPASFIIFSLFLRAIDFSLVVMRMEKLVGQVAVWLLQIVFVKFLDLGVVVRLS